MYTKQIFNSDNWELLDVYSTRPKKNRNIYELCGFKHLIQCNSVNTYSTNKYVQLLFPDYTYYAIHLTFYKFLISL